MDVELHVGIMDNSDDPKTLEKKALRKALIEQRLKMPDRQSAGRFTCRT
jgi:hypothetical protein